MYIRFTCLCDSAKLYERSNGFDQEGTEVFMQFLAELSSSQLLITGSLALFATIILSSVYIRIRGYYNRRIPNLSRRKVFWFFRGAEPSLVEPPSKYTEVVTAARPVQRAFNDSPIFDFDFDDTYESGHRVVTTRADTSAFEASANGDSQGARSNVFEAAESETTYVAAESTPVYAENASTDEFGAPTFVANGSYSQASETEPSFAEATSETAFDDWPNSQTSENRNGDENSRGDESWLQTNAPQFGSPLNSDLEDQSFEVPAVDSNEPADASDTGTYGDDVNEEEDHVLGPVVNESVDFVAQSNPDLDYLDPVTPRYDRLMEEVKRVEPPTRTPKLNLRVVSVCMMSEFNNHVFRDIRGDQLATFLKSRGFILLDQEFHLKRNLLIPEGGIRVRNFEEKPIGELVRSTDETRGFRLYFNPSDCDDPLATLDEMLKIAQSAKGYFSDMCKKPLVIYDGRTPVKPMTQEDYSQLRVALATGFPRTRSTTSNRTVLSRNDYAPSDDLPNRAEQI